MHARTDARNTFARIACKARIERLILTFLRLEVEVDARHIHRASILTYKHSVQKHKYICIQGVLREIHFNFSTCLKWPQEFVKNGEKNY